jgi:hypothetical protein
MTGRLEIVKRIVKASDMTVEGELLWEPTWERVASSRITRFARHVRVPGGYGEMWRWSVENLDQFWQALANTRRNGNIVNVES